MTTLNWLPFVVTSAAAQFGVMMAVGSIPLPFIQNAQAELAGGGGVFRPIEDIRMASMLLTMPVFDAVLLGALQRFVRFPVSSAACASGVRFALAVWAANGLHGIFIDWQTFNISADVAGMFWVSSCLSAAVNGYFLAYFTSADSKKKSN